mgnify:CR=1 FL=1
MLDRDLWQLTWLCVWWVQGPYDSATMAEWFDEGYFEDDTYVRRADEEEWSVYIERWPGGVNKFDLE